MVGRTIGHYRVLEKVGEGGMGVVYRAEDTRLKRTVALKFLPSDALADADLRGRFLREAQAAAALSHPNVCTVYEMDQDLGFLAMEFLEGETVQTRVRRRPLPAAEALDIAMQAAQGLQAAHERGVVHRDIKSANLMVTPHGIVKIMDFGLAQLSGRTRLTKGDGSVGTPAFMSPEQARGSTVDRRTDLWSVGVVLYEMVTGQLPFRGDNEAAVAHSILHEVVEPVTALRAGLPLELDRVIGKALAKDPGERYQHAEDLLVDLKRLKRDAASGRTASNRVAAAIAATGWPSKALRGRWLAGAVLGVLVLLLAGAFLARRLWRTSAPRVVPPVLTRLTSDAGLSRDPAISSDGRLLAYASDRGGEGNLDIWVQHMAGGEPRRLVRLKADVTEPAFSPDGAVIAFSSEREVTTGSGGIYVVSTLGGEPRRIAAEGRRPRFSPDGRQICYWVGVQGPHPGTVSTGKIYVIAFAGGQPRQLAREIQVASYPIWLPRGDGLLFLGARNPRGTLPEYFDWWVAPLDGGPAKATGVGSGLRRRGLSALPRTSVYADEAQFIPETWLPASTSLLFTASLGDSANVWEIPLSSKDWQVSGSPRQLTFGATVDAHPATAAGPNGATRVVFASLASNIDVWSMSLDPSRAKAMGEPRQLTHDASSAIMPALSPDGRRLVFISRRSGNPDIWLKDLETGRETELTFTPQQEWSPVFRPDGGKVAYQAYEGEKYPGGKYPIFTVDAGPGGPGVPTKVCDDCGMTASWTPDGTAILYDRFDPPPEYSGLLALADGRVSRLIEPSSRAAWSPEASPGGKWLAFEVRLGSERRRIFAAPFRAGSPAVESAWFEVTEGEDDFRPLWSPDGNLLYFVSERDGFLCIWAQRLDPASKRPIGEPIIVYHAHNPRHSIGNVPRSALRISVARDKIAFPMAEITGNIWIADWKEQQ